MMKRRINKPHSRYLVIYETPPSGDIPHNLSDRVELGTVEVSLILPVLQVFVVGDVLVHLLPGCEPVPAPVPLSGTNRTGCV